MNTIYKLLSVASLALTSINPVYAQSRHYYNWTDLSSYHYHQHEHTITRDCYSEKREFVMIESGSKTATCEISEPLELLSGIFNYRNGRDNVKYFVGAWSAIINVQARYIDKETNWCLSPATETSKVLVLNHQYQRKFEISNPNLNPEISESFARVQMTRAEAENAFEIARLNCERFASEILE